MISDAHEGIKAAVTKVLCATWKRCRVHFMRNVLAHAGKQGLYHLAARGFVTPLGWARQVLACARPQWPQAASALRGLRPTPGPLPGALALRPRNCRLDTQHIRAVFGLELPRWEPGVADTVARWLAASGEPVPCT